MKENKWIRLLAYVTGLVNQELLLQNEYLAAENHILRTHLPTRLRLCHPERAALAEIGKRLGRKALAQVASVAKPDTILAWYRRLNAQKFDGSKHRRYPGRPRIEPKQEALIVQMAKENSGRGYDRIVGALANLGYEVSDETVGNPDCWMKGLFSPGMPPLYDFSTTLSTSPQCMPAVRASVIHLPAGVVPLRAISITASTTCC
jgi:Homeodomain-like domain